jgi:hypothetical protein
MSLADKPHLDHFSAMTEKLAAICRVHPRRILNEPEIAALSVASDGCDTAESEAVGESTTS